jgi:hypothetical protein
MLTVHYKMTQVYYSVHVPPCCTAISEISNGMGPAVSFFLGGVRDVRSVRVTVTVHHCRGVTLAFSSPLISEGPHWVYGNTKCSSVRGKFEINLLNIHPLPVLGNFLII